MLTRVALLWLVLLTVAACGPQMVNSNVTRFHDLPTAAQGMSFTILPQGPQIGSLEFQDYATLVASRLSTLGFKPVPAGTAPPDLVVTLRYGADDGRTQIDTYPVSGSAGYGAGWPGRWSGVGATFPLGGYQQDIRSSVVYSRFVAVDMLDGAKYRAGATEKRFEGRAVSDGPTRDLPGVMPYLVRALFENFPGANGQTVQVSLPVVAK